MAVQKSITYIDAGGTQRTATVTIDLKKFAFGSEIDNEEVYLEVTAANIAASGIWRRNLDGLVEDALFAQPSASGARFTNWQNAYGERLVTGGVSNFDVSGILIQLQAMS